MRFAIVLRDFCPPLFIIIGYLDNVFGQLDYLSDCVDSLAAGVKISKWCFEHFRWVKFRQIRIQKTWNKAHSFPSLVNPKSFEISDILINSDQHLRNLPKKYVNGHTGIKIGGGSKYLFFFYQGK